MTRWARAWVPALRLAWRDAVRSRGRSALVLAMIALPVLAVTASAVVIATTLISPTEEVERRLGAADALVYTLADVTAIQQGADPERSGFVGDDAEAGEPPDIGSLGPALGRDARAIEFASGYADVAVGARRFDVATTQVDLADPLAAGLFTLREGRLPRSTDEVVVNESLAERGVGIGDSLDVTSADARPTVVGIGDDATYRGLPAVAGPVGSMDEADQANGRAGTWLVEAGAVTWADVQKANAVGFFVLSREVLEHPPSVDQLPEELRYGGGGYTNPATITVLVLVVTMALLEVVLLAGPAFAVTARRQSRTLALMAATGGTPAQARRVVLGTGVVLGSLAAAAGAVLGVAAGALALPVVQRYNDTWLGPFEIPWLAVLGVAAFGLLSAVLAAVVPASIAARQDVVAVLAGRRGDRRPSAKSPVLGVLLIGVGGALSFYGSRKSGGGETWIALAAVVAVLGMILLVPLVVTAVARLAARLPLTMRYAARDAARHRTRTVPAVAAVAATVAGVVTLGIGAASDQRESRETYDPVLPMGDGKVVVWPQYSQATGRSTPASQQQWNAVTQMVRGVDPGVTVLRGVPSENEEGGYNLEIGGRDDPYLSSWGGSVDAAALVDDEQLPPGIQLADPTRRSAAEAALADGRVVVFTDHPVGAEEVRLVGSSWDGVTGEQKSRRRLTVPAYFVQVEGSDAPTPAVLPTSVAGELGQEVRPAGLYLRDPQLSVAQEQDLQERLSGVAPQASLYVERGYRNETEELIVLVVLGALGGVLMLGGTLTATFLALSDARPDLATLAAVGATPGKRRLVAAGFALVIGLVGSVLGAAVGFVPGLAVVRPLTYRDGSTVMCSGSSCSAEGVATGPFYDVPWLLVLAVVVALPLLTALVVGLTARSRLPLVARLD